MRDLEVSHVDMIANSCNCPTLSTGSATPFWKEALEYDWRLQGGPGAVERLDVWYNDDAKRA